MGHVTSTHEKFTPAGWRRHPSMAAPELSIQFHRPVSFDAIQGQYAFTGQLEAPAIYWGKNGRCFAFLHDLDFNALLFVLAACRGATDGRREPHRRLAP